MAVVMVAAPPGCGVSKSPGDGGGGAKGGVAGSTGGGSGPAGAPGAGAAGRDGAPAAGHGGGAAAAGQGGMAGTAAGGRGLGGYSGGSPAGGASGSLGGRAGGGGFGGQDPFPCGMQVLCTIGATRCVQGEQQLCQKDLDGCPFWGVTRGQPPLCAEPRICVPATGRCECPDSPSWCGGVPGQIPPPTGDHCTIAGGSTYDTCRLVSGCFVSQVGVPCPEGTTCREAATRQLVKEGTACE